MNYVKSKEILRSFKGDWKELDLPVLAHLWPAIKITVCTVKDSLRNAKSVEAIIGSVNAYFSTESLHLLSIYRGIPNALDCTDWISWNCCWVLHTYLLTVIVTGCYVYWILEFKPVLVLPHPFLGYNVVVIAVVVVVATFNPYATNVIYIYIYGAPILDVSRSHTTTQHIR